MAKKDPFFTRNWEEKKESRAHTRDQGRVEVKQSSGRVQVVSPYDESFREGARALKGRWRHRSRMWSFAAVEAEQRQALADLLARVYGPDSVPEWLISRRCACGKAVYPGRDLCVSCEREQSGLQRLTEEV